MRVPDPSVPVVDITDGWTRHGRVTMGTPEWVDLCDWVTSHGLDPHQMVASPGLTRDADAYCIRYTTFRRDDDGHPLFDRDTCEFALIPAVEQGEAPPLPFPPSVHLSVPTRPTEEPTRG